MLRSLTSKEVMLKHQDVQRVTQACTRRVSGILPSVGVSTSRSLFLRHLNVVLMLMLELMTAVILGIVVSILEVIIPPQVHLLPLRGTWM